MLKKRKILVIALLSFVSFCAVQYVISEKTPSTVITKTVNKVIVNKPIAKLTVTKSQELIANKISINERKK